MPDTYTVRPGDTLAAIARREGTTVAALLAANPAVTNPNLIRVGQRLTIPQAEAPEPEPPPTPPDAEPKRRGGPPAGFDAAAFFRAVRPLFGGALAQPQVDGLNAILAAWWGQGTGDRRHLAYVLATAKHETAHTMQPIREYGRGRGRPYGKAVPPHGKAYYGRGYVQLTWRQNYLTQGRRLGLDLDGDPDLALRPDVAAAVLIGGMLRGDFTGKKLADYLPRTRTDYVNARRVVNGTDRARPIADLAEGFERALAEAGAPLRW